MKEKKNSTLHPIPPAEREKRININRIKLQISLHQLQKLTIADELHITIPKHKIIINWPMNKNFIIYPWRNKIRNCLVFCGCFFGGFRVLAQ
jgi:hypothetical protein